MGIGAQLEGEHFGRLTVIAQDANDSKSNHRFWLCTCECGNGTIVNSNRLTSGKTKSCGCLRELGENLVGKVFGRLTVISEEQYKHPGKAWLCRCECGNGIITRTGNLKNGSPRSCGCLRVDSMEKSHANRKFNPNSGKGEMGFKSILHAYKIGAKKRGLEFNLSDTEFQELTSSVCSYCGCKPNSKRERKVISIDLQEWNLYLYNGIDRVDNDKGYTLENSVTCCKTCNFMKRAMDQKEFINKAIEIGKHQLANKYNST